MADPKKIATPAGKKELEQWLQQQLAAASQDAPGHSQGRPDQGDPFYQEAIEGLKKFSSTREIYKHTNRINHMVQKRTGAGRKKTPLVVGQFFWFIVAAIVIIMVVVVAFIVIRMRLGQI